FGNSLFVGARVGVESETNEQRAQGEGRNRVAIVARAGRVDARRAVLEPLEDPPIPDIRFDVTFLLESGDRLQLRRQPPLITVAVQVDRFGPQLVAVAADRRHRDLPGYTERPVAAIAGDVGELELVGGGGEEAGPRPVFGEPIVGPAKTSV